MCNYLNVVCLIYYNSNTKKNLRVNNYYTNKPLICITLSRYMSSLYHLSPQRGAVAFIVVSLLKLIFYGKPQAPIFFKGWNFSLTKCCCAVQERIGLHVYLWGYQTCRTATIPFFLCLNSLWEICPITMRVLHST